MIKVYSMDNCPYCSKLKEYLDMDKIQYLDVNINLPENEPEFDKLSKITKSDSVPIVKIGNQLLVPNVSFKSIEEAFGIIKKLTVKNV